MPARVADQHDPRVALVAPVRPGPVDQHDQRGCGSRSGRTRARPARTTRRSTPEKRKPCQVDHRGHAADRGEVAVVAIAERRRRRLARRGARGSRARRARPSAWPRARRPARACRPRLHASPGRRRRRSPDGPARVRSGCDRHAPGAIAAARPSVRASGEAATPAAHSTVRAAMRSSPSTYAVAHRSRVTGAPVRTSTPRRSQLRARLRRQRLGERRRARAARLRAAARARCRGSMRRNSLAQRVARDLGQRAGQFDAGRAAADHGEA